MDYEVKSTCQTCNGTGTQPGGGSSTDQPCPDCNGTGSEWIAQVNDLKDDITDINNKLDDIIEKLNQ